MKSKPKTVSDKAKEPPALSPEDRRYLMDLRDHLEDAMIKLNGLLRVPKKRMKQ